MNTYSLGLYEKSMPNELSIKEKLEIAKKTNFDYLEISIDETDEKLDRLDWNESTIKQIIDDMYQIKLPIRSMCLSGHRKYSLGSNYKDIEEKSLSIMQKAIKLADLLGIRIIQLAGYDVYYEQSSDKTKERFYKNLVKSTLMASNLGIVLAFETMETPFMDTVQKAMEYVEKVNNPFLKIYPDCGNITNAAKLYNSSVKEDLLKGNGNIVAIHLKETVPGKYREIPFGTGHVDFDMIIKTSLGMGIRRYVTELWKTDDSWYENIQFANNMMRAKLDRYIGECENA